MMRKIKYLVNKLPTLSKQTNKKKFTQLIPVKFL